MHFNINIKRHSDILRRHLPLLWQVSLYFAVTLCIITAPVSAYCATDVSGSQQYLEYVDSADRFLNAGRWVQAEDMIRRALRVSPGNPCNPLLFSNLGVCLTAQQKYQEALQAFEISLIRAPESVNTLISRGKTYIAMERPAEAVADFTEALAIDSTLLQPRLLRARLYLTSNHIDKAQDDYEAVLRMHPAEPEGMKGLGNCGEIKGDYTSAVKHYRTAAEITQDAESQADIQVCLARALIENDQLNEADNVVREGITRFPRNGMLYLMRAWLHKLRYQLEDEKIDKKMAAEYGVEPQIIELFLHD
ncbi:MAG: tetratricopeptide repeat protein [Muribaculaceae bacterium]|nr:tetratricopeptide repeat protein [Muribaculaceae bacterium]